MDSAYVYEPLISTRHIRVLTLAPSEDPNAALRCSLHQQHIDDPSKQYEAISYTWGDQGRTEPLICDETIIKITPNLASALLRFRSLAIPRRLWADAICINQGDQKEKGHQIPLMSRIFRYATKVRVWLGNGDEDESSALHDLAAFARASTPPGPPSNYPLENQRYGPEEYQTLINTGISAKKLFTMPWFGRRWIVQELVLNGNVMFYYGQAKASWPTMHYAAHTLPDAIWNDNLDIQIRRKLRQLGDLWRALCFASHSAIDCGIYSLLHSFHDLQCKEMRDRLYAIAGLADDVDLNPQPSTIPAGIASVAPDYSTIVSAEELFQDLAFKMIQSGKVFSTLAHAGASRITNAEKTLPSWVPDIRQNRPWPLIATERNDDFRLVESCQSSNGVLTLKVTVCGWTQNMRPSSVEEVFEPPEGWIEQSSFNTIWDYITQWLHKSLMRQLHNSFDSGRTSLPYPLSPTSMLSDIAHILWSIARSQAQTEHGYESFQRLLSLGEWQAQVTGRVELNEKCLGYLKRGLSARRIYIGDRPQGFTFNFQSACLCGFGPSGLQPRDAIFFPSKDFKEATSLFLRPEGTEHKVLGGGLSWTWAHNYYIQPSPENWPEEIELRLT